MSLFATVSESSASASAPSPGSVPAASLSVGVSGSRTIAVGTAVTASGTVQAPGGGLLTQVGGVVLSLVQALLQPLRGVDGARTTLELKTPTGWSPFARLTADARGGYAFSVPTYSYGARTWRVSTTATATSAAAVTSPFTVAVKTPYTPQGAASAYRLLPDGHARWNPCASVPYYVNTAGMPRGAMSTVRGAMARLQAASGLIFRYAGSSRGVPFASGVNATGMPSYGLTIAWAKPTKVRRLRGSTVAISGSWSEVTRRGKARRYVAGGLVIDRTEKLKAGFGRGRTLGFVLMHELGHAVGLGHISASTQVMSARLTPRSIARYGAGDLAGLAKVGLGAGCL